MYPLTVGLAGGITFLMLVPIRRVILLIVVALFAGIYFSVECATSRPNGSTERYNP